MHQTQLIRIDFNQNDYLHDFVALMNHYITDKMGGGKVLSPQKGGELFELMKYTPNTHSFFLQLDQTFIGLANCFSSVATFSVGKCLNIHDVIIHQDYRGQGFSYRLLSGIIAYANNLQFKKISLEVRNDNFIAQNLYKKFGFAPTNPEMLFWTKIL